MITYFKHLTKPICASVEDTHAIEAYRLNPQFEEISHEEFEVMLQIRWIPMVEAQMSDIEYSHSGIDDESETKE